MMPQLALANGNYLNFNVRKIMMYRNKFLKVRRHFDAFFFSIFYFRERSYESVKSLTSVSIRFHLVFQRNVTEHRRFRMNNF